MTMHGTDRSAAGTTPAAGWYPDPAGAGLRWWDGTAWTEHLTAAAPAAPETAASAAEPRFAPLSSASGAGTGSGGQQAGFGGQQTGFGGQQAGFGAQQTGSGAAQSWAGGQPASGPAPAQTPGWSAGHGAPRTFTPDGAGTYASASAPGTYTPGGAGAYAAAGPGTFTPGGAGAPAAGGPGAFAPGGYTFGAPTPMAPYPPAGPPPKNGLATASLVLGIAMVVGALFTGYFLASGLAVLISVKALQRANELAREGHGPVGRARAVWGLVLSSLLILAYLAIRFTGG